MDTTTIIIIAAVVGVAALVIGLACKHQWGLLRQVIFALVTAAERQYGNGTGKIKFAEVVKALVPFIPAILAAFISDKTLEGLVNDVLKQAKELWDKNPKLLELPKNTTAEPL
jgi:hypothetical protein